MARLPVPGADDGSWGDILNEFLLVGHNSDGTLKGVVHDSGNETVGGIKTFVASPVVPTPTSNTDAANKAYVDSVATSGAPDADASTKGLIQLAGDLSGTAASPQIAAGAIVNADINAAAAIAQSKISGLTSDLAGKEPTITAGTTGQYWRGDKSWQTLDKTAVGLSSVTNDAQLKAADLDTDITLAANSDTKIASQKAIKSYVDTGLATKQASLGYTAENAANKDTDITLAANSDTKYPSQKAIKSYVDTGLSGKASSTHQSSHQSGGGDALTGNLDANARVSIAKAGTEVAKRRQINFIEGSNVTITTSDDSLNERVDVTIAAAGGGGGGSSPLTTKGDLYTFTTVDARLAIGSNNQTLIADSAQSTGMKWGTLPVAGGGTGATDATTARTNLGLGDSATKNVGTSAGTVAAGDDARFTQVDYTNSFLVMGG